MTDYLEPYRQLARSIRFVPPLGQQQPPHQRLTEPAPAGSGFTITPVSFSQQESSDPSTYEPPIDPSVRATELIRAAVSRPTVLPMVYQIQENPGDRISRLAPPRSTPVSMPAPKLPMADPTWQPVSKEAEPLFDSPTARSTPPETTAVRDAATTVEPSVEPDSPPDAIAITPETPAPEGSTSEVPTPEVSTSEVDAPEAPTLEALAPEVSASQAPVPEAPIPEAPVPEGSASQAPVPEAPTPEAPTLEAPTPEGSAPEGSASQAPDPEAPAPEAPASQAPVPEAPVPEAPAPEGSASQAPESQPDASDTHSTGWLETAANFIDSVTDKLAEVTHRSEPPATQEKAEVTHHSEPPATQEKAEVTHHSEPPATQEKAEVTHRSEPPATQEKEVCPKCGSPDVHPQGKRQGKKKYHCNACDHQFTEASEVQEPISKTRSKKQKQAKGFGTKAR